MPDDRPYRHDCAQCRGLGTAILGGARFDLYFCEKPPLKGTVVGRHGDAEWEQVSCGIGAMPRLRRVAAGIDNVPLDTLMLMEAHDRAIAKGWCR